MGLKFSSFFTSSGGGGGDINNNNEVLVARGGPETANPARTGETLGDGSLGDPQQ